MSSVINPNSSILGPTIEPSEMTLGTGVGTGILSRPIFATTATAAATTTLTVTSASTQEFTGSTTQTVTMPEVSTLVAGWAASFINDSTGNVTLQSSGSNTIVVLAAGQSVTLVLKSASADTTAAAWCIKERGPALWLAAVLDGTTEATNATETSLSWTGAVGNMTDRLSAATFTAPMTGYYTFRLLLQYDGVGPNATNDEGFLTVNLTDGNNTLIKTIRAGGVLENAASSDTSGTETLEWTLSLTEGDTVKCRVTYADGGDGFSLWFTSATCQLKITQEL